METQPPAEEPEIEGHECSNCGTRWQSPDYSSCPRCGYAPTELYTRTTEAKEIPVFKEGDRVSIDAQPYKGVATIRSFWGCVANLVFNDGSTYSIGISYLSHAVDPRDAEIEALKARVAELEKVTPNIEIERGDSYGVPYVKAKSRSAKVKIFETEVDVAGILTIDKNDIRYWIAMLQAAYIDSQNGVGLPS